MLVATRLIIRDRRRLIPNGSDIAERFTEATVTKLVCAAKKLNRIVDAERSQQKLHSSIMLVAQRQDVGPHGGNSRIVSKTKPAAEAAGELAYGVSEGVVRG